jgi:hypothetical protein
MRPLLPRALGLALTSLALGGVLLTGAPLVSADTPLAEGGQRGVHFLQDTNPANRGADCQRTAAGSLKAITIRPPVMYAVNRTSQIDRQMVAWQAQVIRADTGAVVAASAIAAAPAADNVPAVFAPVTFQGPWAPGAYRARVRMAWYTPGANIVEGTSLHQVDFHGQVINGILVGTAPVCTNPL